MDVLITVAKKIDIGIFGVELLVSNIIGSRYKVITQFFVVEFGDGQVYNILGFF